MLIMHALNLCNECVIPQTDTLVLRRFQARICDDSVVARLTTFSVLQCLWGYMLCISVWIYRITFITCVVQILKLQFCRLDADRLHSKLAVICETCIEDVNQPCIVLSSAFSLHDDFRCNYCSYVV